MAIIREILQIKGHEIWYVSPDTTVLDALRFMADKDIGAILVLENGQLTGIFSERDFVRSIANSEHSLLNTCVNEYMTKEVFYLGPENSIDDCMQLMTQKRIRHLPIIENNELVGLISIGDVVKQVISTEESRIAILENYIEGRD
jgi:CBS domain-containing protein